jgi:hypothetical protein
MGNYSECVLIPVEHLKVDLKVRVPTLSQRTRQGWGTRIRLPSSLFPLASSLLTTGG